VNLAGIYGKKELKTRGNAQGAKFQSGIRLKLRKEMKAMQNKTPHKETIRQGRCYCEVASTFDFGVHRCLALTF